MLKVNEETFTSIYLSGTKIVPDEAVKVTSVPPPFTLPFTLPELRFEETLESLSLFILLPLISKSMPSEKGMFA
jgi:hypothetical protein